MERRRGLVVRAEEPPALANPGGAPPAQRRDDRHARRSARDRRHRAAARARSANRPASSSARSAAGPSAGIDRRRRRCRKWTRWPSGCATTCPAIRRRRRSSTATSSSTTSCSIPLDVGRIVAVFDWEMSALGDPLVDLGIVLTYWSPTAPPEQRDALTSVTDRPGFFTREEIIERYAARSGRDLSGIRYYEIFRGLQDRRRDPADLLSLRARADHGQAVRHLRRARGLSGAARSPPRGAIRHETQGSDRLARLSPGAHPRLGAGQDDARRGLHRRRRRRAARRSTRSRARAATATTCPAAARRRRSPGRTSTSTGTISR